MSAVVFKDYSYAYNGTNKVLDNINLEIAKGSFTVITGQSGAGKTTLCKAIAGIVPHYYGGSLSGSVFVNDTRTVDVSMGELAEHVGSMLDDYESQIVAMTVEEEVAFSLENQGLRRHEIRERVKDSLAMTGLSGLEHHEVASLSGGQKQRLVIAAILVTRPNVLVLDEPASALDPEGVQEIYRLLGELNSKYGMTIIVAEHELSHILPYVQQIILMNHGRVMKDGICSEVLEYMWQDKALYEAVPPLWAVKLTLEDELGISFADWFDNETALRDVKKLLTMKRGACLSA